MTEELKTSEEWQQQDEFKDVIIYDPDGWRDKNRPCDFYKDKITKQDFIERKSLCTVMWTNSVSQEERGE